MAKNIVSADSETRISLRYYPTVGAFVVRDDITGEHLSEFPRSEFVAADKSYAAIVKEVRTDLRHYQGQMTRRNVLEAAMAMSTEEADMLLDEMTGRL